MYTHESYTFDDTKSMKSLPMEGENKNWESNLFNNFGEANEHFGKR